MEIIVKQNYEKVSEEAFRIMRQLIKEKPNACLGLATGSTPLGLYQLLIKAYQAGDLSFKDITTYNLDEYLGIDRSNPQSFYAFMHKNLFDHIDINIDHTHIPSNDINRIKEIAHEYNEALKAQKIDLQILGIGSNGHIGFNEPGTSFEQETFVVELDEQTKKDNARFFNSLEEVPSYAITMGIKNIMQSERIILIATGKQKAKAIKAVVEGNMTTDIPATVLQNHPDVTLIIDKAAASLLNITLSDIKTTFFR